MWQNFPQLSALPSIEQEMFAIEACLLCHGILDLDDGELWRTILLLTWRSRNNVLLDLRGLLTGTLYVDRRLADYFVKFDLCRRSLDETAALLRRVGNAISQGDLPRSNLAELFEPLRCEFCYRERLNDLGTIYLWGDNW